MTNKSITIIIGLILIVSTGSLVYLTKEPVVLPVEDDATEEIINKIIEISQTLTPADTKKDSNVLVKPVVTTPAPKQTTPKVVTPPSGITLSQISKHDSRTSCWSAINGSVYDLTSWIPNHPGGERTITSLCGLDGSNDYNDEHGGSSKPARILGGFKIGTLSK